MNADVLHRRVAAWLLSLPGPLNASDQAAARSEACRKFDPHIPEEQFDAALKGLGYVIRPVSRSVFAIQFEH